MRDDQDTLRYPDGSGRSLAAFIGGSPAGSTIELAPGRYEGKLHIAKPVCLRGAGDLTRIFAGGEGRVIEVRLETGGEVVLESILLEGGGAASGAGIWLGGGRLRLHNVHIQRCEASGGGGGAIHVEDGELDASVLRVNDVRGDKGGAIWVQGAEIRLRDSQIMGSEARQGGALAVEGPSRVSLESVTVKKARATTPAGGQALYVSGAQGVRPRLDLRRVRLEDAPLGLPVFVDPDHPGDLSLSGCDVPRMIQSVVGVIDGGENRWR